MVQRSARGKIPGAVAARQRTNQKSEVIRRTALRLFQVHGFKKVTIREIAREADVSQVTIYNYFGSKDGLVRDVVRNSMLDTVARFQELLAEDRPFLEKLEDIVLRKTEAVSQYRGELVQKVVSDDPEMQGFIEGVYDREIKPMIISFFNEGKRQGYVNPGLSEEAILTYTEILRYGLMAKPELMAAPHKSSGLVQDFMALYLYGLMGNSGLPARSQMRRKGDKHGR